MLYRAMGKRATRRIVDLPQQLMGVNICYRSPFLFYRISSTALSPSMGFLFYLAES